MATKLKDKRVVVMGLGRFGGGIGVTRFLVEQGANVLVTDRTPKNQLTESLAVIAEFDLELRLGEHRESDFESADLIVVNPAVKPNGNRYLEAAANGGVPTTSEIRLLVERLPNQHRIIGVTGSAGKSTVTAMIGTILAETPNARCHVGGNIGGSLLNKLDDIREDDWIILELSSFMLESLRPERWSPHMAVVTNLSPNHIDWHGSQDAYYNAKQVILDYQSTSATAILGPGVSDNFTPRGKTIQVDADNDSISLLLPGRHNQVNAQLAIAACSVAQVSAADAAGSLVSFPGLPHRLQFVCERGGVQYVNDSKCTTPEAASLAIESFPRRIIHIILGGDDKGSDLTAMAAIAKDHCKVIYTIGRTSPAIAEAADKATGTAQVIRCETLNNAVEQTAARVSPDDVVLLSPGCASWDQFTNFEERGRCFVEAVLDCTGEGAPAPQGTTPNSS